MKAEDIKYDTPIPVTVLQYRNIMSKCRGMVSGRRDGNGQYWVKVWLMDHIDYIAKQFKL
jgi:hypothetical protein